MLTDVQRQQLAPQARTMQIIVAALISGVLVFAAIAFLASDGPPAKEPFLAYAAVGAALVSVLLWAVVPAVVGGRLRQSIVDGNAEQLTMRLPLSEELGDVGRLATTYMARLIIAAALLEGAAFLNLISYMVERQPISLITAGVLALLLASQIPTRSRLEEWIDREMTTIAQLREMRTYDGR
jgi:hypothetical protein